MPPSARREWETVDFTKKVRKAKSDALEPGEEFPAATFAQPAGSFGRQVGLGVAGIAGAAAANPAARKREEAHRGATGGGLAAAIPSERVVPAITGRRLLVFGHGQMTGKPTDLRAEFPLGDVHEVNVELKKLNTHLTVRFSDNSLADLDVVKTAKPGPFADAFRTAKGI